jgi:CDP-glucose 4,6-dehydratase
LEALDVSGLEIYRGKRVLLTGHTGFKGAWLSVWLRSLGAEVVGYALAPPTTPNMFDAVGVDRLVDDQRGDIRDVARVRRLIEEFNPEIVFHLAAQAIVRASYHDPVDTFATNVVGTASVLDACRHAPHLRAIIVVTSDKCYENQDWAWGYRETDRLGGFDPYSSSKACAELVSEAFRRSYFQDTTHDVGVATARAGNVIGGGDWAMNRLVPDLARAALAGEPAVIRNPTAVRPWQHVLEPLAGYLTLARHLLVDARRYSGGWNFGPSAATVQSVETVIEKLSHLWGHKLRWSVDPISNPHEAARLTLDSSKAAADMNWRPHLSLDDTLRLAVEWYDGFGGRNADMHQITESQIASYQGAQAC